MLPDRILSTFHVWWYSYGGVENLTTDHPFPAKLLHNSLKDFLTVLTKISLDFQVSQMPKAYYFSALPKPY